MNYKKMLDELYKTFRFHHLEDLYIAGVVNYWPKKDEIKIRWWKDLKFIQDKYNLWGELSFTNEETYYHIKLELGFTDYYNNPKIYIKYNILDKTINTNNVDNPYSNFKLYKYIHKYIIEVIELIEKTESN